MRTIRKDHKGHKESRRFSTEANEGVLMVYKRLAQTAELRTSSLPSFPSVKIFRS
jgi:hypothetical protein